MKRLILITWFITFVQKTKSSFWNEIPPRCIYDRTTLFSCWNTTFTHPIPLFNDLKYTLNNHNVKIRDSYFNLSLNDLFNNVGPNIEILSLSNNTFSSELYSENNEIYFRLLQYFGVHDRKSLQWFQLNTSRFPRLIELDLSFNAFTDEKLLVFNHQNFPVLKYLNLSNNQLQSIDNVTGTRLNRIETLILSFNPLKTIVNKINQFQSLKLLDLSSTNIKQLFSITLLPRLEIFSCRSCQQLSMNEYEKFLSNCSLFYDQLILDLTETTINSLQFFNPYIECIKDLIFENQNLTNSVTTKDLLSSFNLETIRICNVNNMESINLNVYDRLKMIDFSYNIDLKNVSLYLMSAYTYLQSLIISNTGMKNFYIDFNKSTKKFLHVDLIVMSNSQLETLDFIKYVTFYTLDVSYNRLKIININDIHYFPGMFELSSMNFLNLSSNQLEVLKINWENESPHTIDLSKNNLNKIELHGKSTYSLLLNQNRNLSITPTTFIIDLPLLQYLDFSSIHFNSFQNLIYIHNHSNIHTLILNNNQLERQSRILNWSIFYPWHQTLNHIILKNMSIEKVYTGATLDNYIQLFTIDMYENFNISCECSLHPFINWLKISPLSTGENYGPRAEKQLFIECPIQLLFGDCAIPKPVSKIVLAICFIGIFLIMILIIFKLLHCYLKRKSSKSYKNIVSDNDSIALTEQNILETTNDQGISNYFS